MRHHTELRERISTQVYDQPQEACRELAIEIAELIRSRAAEGKQAVLGLATGSTPVPLYRELIRLHKEEGLSFANVVTFNLDEYFGLGPEHPESYARFMADQLFDHVDLAPENTNIPSGILATEEVFAFCEDYEKRIRDAGGIDIQILGIGRTGHIGFNEPGSAENSPTRRITLDRVTREDAAQDFLGIDNVPRFAITMGVGTILGARRLALLAWGEGKADIVAEAVEGEITDAISASFLQNHEDARFIIDAKAASSLTRFRHPWLVGAVDWDQPETVHAVSWLCRKSGKSVLRLVDEDYNENGMGDLLTRAGTSYHLNIDVFNTLGHTITGWPGGKPDADDTFRPEKAQPYPKRVIVFAPEPQDELIGMAGTIERLVEHGHEVHVVYLTSGNLRVSDRQVENFAKVMRAAGSRREEEFAGSIAYSNKLLEELAAKGDFGEDGPGLRDVKSLMRRESALEAITLLGVDPDKVHFLKLPFYESGRYRRFSLGDADVEKVGGILAKLQPDQIFASGNLSDPSSHRYLSFDALRQALASNDVGPWAKRCSAWLYRVSERRCSPQDITMAIPLSPDQLATKIKVIHEYRSHTVPSGLNGESNQAIAIDYNALGLAEYEAIEAFERWAPKQT